MATFHSGSWKIGGFALPDFGVTERLTGSRTAQGGSNIIGGNRGYAQETPMQNTGLIGAPQGISFGAPIPQDQWQYNNSNGTALGATTASRSAIPSSGQQISGGSAIQNAQRGFNSAITQNRDTNLSLIDQQFQEESGRLGELENRTRSNYASAIQQAQDYYPQFEAQLAKEKQTDLDTVTAREDQVKQESNRGLAKTRQLLSDLQRSQAARMSATGNYSSSVSDAFGESFGRKAFDANSQIQQSRDQALQQLGIQRQETENFYSKKSLEAKQSYDAQLSQLQQQLQSQLDAINMARGQASSAKAQATAEAWQSYTNNKLSLDQQIMQYQQDLDSWMEQQKSALSEADLWTTGGADQNLLNSIQGQSSMANPTANTPMSQTQQAMIMTNKRPRYLEDQLTA